MSLALLFIIDSISTLSVTKDTSFDFMETAQKRGHRVFVARLGDLAARGDVPLARARQVVVQRVVGDHYAWQGGDEDWDMRRFDVVFMRKDPPFDMNYIFATYILSLAAEHALLINDPRGLRDCNEKAYVLRFPEWIPETVVTSSAARLKAFVREHKKAVIKPLDGKGGQGILMVQEGDLNNSSIIELLTEYEQRFVMMQRYVPESRLGDKRLLLVDGELVGGFLRVPPVDDLRGNMSVGATVHAMPITDRDRAICAALGPVLRRDGHVFAGIDVLGDVLTEINVTSPTGVQQTRDLTGVDVSAAMMDWVERRLGA